MTAGPAPLRARRVIAVTVATVAIVLGLATCSIPADDQVTPIRADELGPELANTTTTSTTVAPSTRARSTPASDSTTTSTTTTIAIPTRTVNTYFTIGNSGALQFVAQQLPEPVSIQSVIEVLVDPTRDLREYALSTSVRRGLISGVPRFDRSVLTVSLDGEILDRMPAAQQARAIAQIVLTLTSFTTDRGNIGLVQFEVDGEPIEVTPPGQGGVATAEPVGYDDFASSIATTPGATPTTTAAPATTRAPATTPPQAPVETSAPPSTPAP